MQYTPDSVCSHETAPFSSNRWKKLPYICRACTWRCNFLHKSSEEAGLSWLPFCLFPVVGAEGTGQSFSPVNMCKSLNLPDKIIKVPVKGLLCYLLSFKTTE